MENENIPQPLDSLMTQLGLSNADLVKASTEQLTFKMVQKGRRGKRLTPNIQDKILRALLTAKPGVKLARRHLFRYEPDEALVSGIQEALSLSAAREIKYPQFVDLIGKAGVTRYLVELVPGRITFFGIGGEAHIIEAPVKGEGPLGRYDEEKLRSAIADAQKDIIDHAAFLKRIYEAGITQYEANIRELSISYRGLSQSYKEKIPKFGEEPVPQFAAPKVTKPKVAKKKSNVKRIKKTGKFVVKHRVKKRRFMRRK